MLDGHWHFVFFLFLTFLVTFTIESFGFSLIIPLLSSMISPTQEYVGTNTFIRVLLDVGKIFPQENRIVYLIIFLVLIFTLKSFFLIVSGGMTKWFIGTLKTLWMSKSFNKSLQQEYGKIIYQPQGKIIANIVEETNQASISIYLLIAFFARFVQISVIVLFLIMTSWQVTFVIMSVSVILMLITWRASSNYSYSAGKKRQNIRQASTDIVTETIGNIKTVKLHNLAENRVKKLSYLQKKYRYIDTIFEIFSSFPTNVIDLFAIIVGGSSILFMVFLYEMELSQIIPLVAFVGVLFMRLASAAGYLFSRRAKIITAIPSLQTVFNMMNTEVEKKEGGIIFLGLKQDIQFHSVFMKPKGREVVHNNISFTIPKTGLTGIVGPSGSGKTSLVDLIVGLRTPTSGTVYINNIPVSEYNLSTLRSKVAYLSQEPQLFNLTVSENLRLASPEASDADLISAAKLASAHTFIISMKEGYDTPLGRGALSLSGGQRQRLALARELLKKPELFIFDEPTSALDSDSQKIIKELIYQLAHDYPVIVITHNTDLVKDAEQVLLLKDGGLSIERVLDDKNN